MPEEGLETPDTRIMNLGATVAVALRLPLSAVVPATLLTSHAGSNVEPLIIVGVVSPTPSPAR